MHAKSTKPLNFNSMEPKDLPVVIPGRQTNIFYFLAQVKPDIQKIQNELPQNVQKLAAPIQKKIQKVSDILVPVESQNS